MPIEILAVVLTLILGLAIGVMVGWLASRPAHTRLQHEVDTARTRLHTELEKDRAVHAERLKAYDEAEGKLREAFQALSADALKTNNEAFLSLAETRLREARTQAAGDIDARK
jgi:DNA recombination protein RmuC